MIDPMSEQVATALFLHDNRDDPEARSWHSIEEEERVAYRAEAERHIVVRDALAGRMPRT